MRAVVFDDVLGIHAELDAEMEAHVRDYRDEWAETLADPERLARFTRHLNGTGVDLGARIPVGAP